MKLMTINSKLCVIGDGVCIYRAVRSSHGYWLQDKLLTRAMLVPGDSSDIYPFINIIGYIIIQLHAVTKKQKDNSISYKQSTKL